MNEGFLTTIPRFLICQRQGLRRKRKNFPIHSRRSGKIVPKEEGTRSQRRGNLFPIKREYVPNRVGISREKSGNLPGEKREAPGEETRLPEDKKRSPDETAFSSDENTVSSGLIHDVPGANTAYVRLTAAL